MLLIPSELLAATERLTHARRAAVFAARAAWIDNGLLQGDATRKAVVYAGRLRGKALARVSRRARAVSQAASQHDKAMQSVFMAAVQRAQAVVSLSHVEAVLALGDVPTEAFEHAVHALGDALA